MKLKSVPTRSRYDILALCFFIVLPSLVEFDSFLLELGFVILCGVVFSCVYTVVYKIVFADTVILSQEGLVRKNFVRSESVSWDQIDQVIRSGDRLILLKHGGQKLENEEVSGFCWRNTGKIIAFVETPEALELVQTSYGPVDVELPERK